ncbi:hypothetical protein BROUX41_002709 [Berkeleyomyces rouxiae]|uniref:uncharacterized protein n=1 Tax=Berkeleyomyces rouxiae TaxID=2035830 RepID=UPI003B7FEDB9
MSRPASSQSSPSGAPANVVAESRPQQSTQPPQTQTQTQTQTQPQPQPPLPKTHSSPRISQQRPAKQKSHIAGRLHTRVPSAKALHNAKYHAQSNAALSTAAARPPNRRTQSEQRLTHTLANVTSAHSNSNSSNPALANHTASASSSANLAALKKTSSHTAIARNKSHSEVAAAAPRRHAAPAKSSLAPKRTGSAANTSAAAASRTSRSAKQQVLFDVGTDNPDDDDEDDDDDEWQDASNSASPFIKNHVPPAAPPKSSRQPPRVTSMPQVHSSRAHVPDVPNSQSTLVASEATSSSHDTDMPTSRFIDAQMPTLASEGSFYTTHGSSDAGTPARNAQRIRAAAQAARLNSIARADAAAALTDDEEVSSSTLPIRRAPLSAQKSRTQQKLDLQRASSVMDMGDPAVPQNGIDVPAAHHLIAVVQPGYDGTATRDPRVAKLLEHVGAGYMVIRRYQNPLARCVDRMPAAFGLDRPSTSTSTATAATPQKRTAHGAAAPSGTMTPDSYARHMRRSSTASRPGTARSMHPAMHGFDDHKMLPASSIPVLESEDVTAELQNLWDKSMDLGVSQ